MIKEYVDEYYNDVLVLGREISEDYKFSLSTVSKCFVYIENDEVFASRMKLASMEGNDNE